MALTNNGPDTETEPETGPAGRAREILVPGLMLDLLRGTDLVLAGIVGMATYIAYVLPQSGILNMRYPTAICLALLILGVMFQSVGLYRPAVIFERSLRLTRALGTCLLSFALLITIAFALKISSDFSRIWAVTWLIGCLLSMTTTRLLFSIWITKLSRAGHFASRTVILGTGTQARKLAEHLMESDALQTRVLGHIEDRETGAVPPVAALKLLGNLETLTSMIRDGLVDQVIVALPWQDADHIRDVTQSLALTPVTVRLAPDLAGFAFMDRDFVQLAGIPMLQLYDRPISGWSRVVKGLEDRILAVLFLFLLAPVMVLIVLAIRLDSPGPALFRQKRTGFNNNPINIFKFRTMVVDADANTGLVSAQRDDPRVTRVGRFLRRTSLDELPQLFNVLRGEMSIVGPRPLAVDDRAEGHLFEEAVEQYAARHRVKPGITGWAQVNGWRGGGSTIEMLRNRVDHDLYYIDNWSVWFDLKIIARTTGLIFKDNKAY